MGTGQKAVRDVRFIKLSFSREKHEAGLEMRIDAPNKTNHAFLNALKFRKTRVPNSKNVFCEAKNGSRGPENPSSSRKIWFFNQIFRAMDFICTKCNK
jgi:hypothetical protein